MADYFLDLPSSPDPLTDDVPPSSAHPPSRRITKPQNDIPSLSIPQSSPSRRVRASSPRKRTFELDVGNERSPQRIRVTVEAEEHLKHGNVSRQLFSSSPTRKARKSKAATTTTTTVPLNDEQGDMDGENTPRKRGRPRRISNGTPLPKVRKRAGTPVQRKSKQPRLEGEALSEASMMSDAPMDMGEGDEQKIAQPKPRTRTRKTPKKTTATGTVPSSQLSTTATGRKRGRPRKALMPEEVAVLAEAAAETTALPASESDIRHEVESEAGRDSDMPTEGLLSDGVGHDNNMHIDSDLPQRENSITPTPSTYNITQQERKSIERVSTSPRALYQESDGNDHDLMTFDDYPAMEQRSDTESEQDDGNDMTYNRQDTIANASDFSMIAVESLPSFQNSFRASQRSGSGAATSDAPEYGEETSRIINETLESLRRSMQDGTSGPPRHIEHDEQDGRSLGQGETETIHQSTQVTSSHRKRAFSKSPRRPRATPLNRQVFAGRATHEDSFSSLPDSVLHAATPGRLPMKQTVPENYGEDHDEYEDSFSEVPDEILEAATPRPPKRSRSVNNSSPLRTSGQQQPSHPAARRTSAEYGSGRLPTPDETSSSNSGSKQANEEDTAGAHASHAESRSTNHVDIPSSPPNMTRPRALDYGPSELHNELNVNGLQGTQSPSTRVQLPAKSAAIPFQSLEAPLPTARPSLSPIVRAGRTLQNVMSDRSSPEVREGSLGSPFRGSAESQRYRQSSVGRSPSPQRNREVESQPPSTPTPMDRSFRPNTSRNYGRASLGTNEARRSFGHGRQNNSAAEALNTTVETTNEASDVGKQAYAQSTISSTKAAPPSEDELSEAAQEGSPVGANNEGHGYLSESSENESFVAQQGTIRSQLATTRDGEVEESDEGHHEEVMSDQDQRDDEPNDEAEEMDDLDVWDIEASRPSPVKQPQPPPEPVQIAPKADIQPSRRRKIPSPWRKTSRRLIYQDEIASSSQIEIEDDAQSEVEEAPELEPILEPVAPTRQQHSTSPPESHSQKDVPRVVPESPQADKLAQTPARAPRNDIQEHIEHHPGRSDPIEFDGPEEHPGDAEYSDDLAGLADQDSPEPEDQDMPGGITDGGDTANHEEEHPEPDEVELPRKPEKIVAPAIADESGYSLLKEKETPKPQQKPAPPKSRFFSGFDFLNFFSSPANLPGKKTADTTPAEKTKKPSPPEPVLPTIERPREAPRAVLSTGLFPSIPQTQNPKPGPQREQSVFSPGRTLRSNDTIPDTYAPTSSTRGRSTSPAESAALSTPERQEFSPIEQKRNFTPQPGQRGSLFMSPTKAQPSAPRIEEEEDTEDTEESEEESEHQESSGMTDGSDYERVPPRAKPSRWDRNASPIKSSFRSPLKPTTPGRVVAFTNNMNHVLSPSPLAQAQDSGMGNGHNLSIFNMRSSVDGVGSTDGTYGGNIAQQGPLLQRPNFEGKENLLPPPLPYSKFSEEKIAKNVANDRLDHNVPNRNTTNLDTNRGFGASVDGNANGHTNRNPPAYLPSQSSQRPQPALNQNRARNDPPITNGTRPISYGPLSSPQNTEDLSFIHHVRPTTNGPLNPPPPISKTQTRPQPPQPQPHPQLQLQSQKWLKSHWVLLDEILRLRRSDPDRFGEVYAHLPQRSERKSRNLLGKEVVANGERMQLREWHLDVVDAFVSEMDMMRNAGMTLGGSGWSEKDVAKRVFCLIVGEEKRAGEV